MADPCTHLDQIANPEPRSWGCGDCLAAGKQDWVNLRVCGTCGHWGCCDNSPGRSATANFGEKAPISGYAKIAQSARAARIGRNPATGEDIHNKASKKARITPLKAFKDAVMSGSAGAAKKAGAKKTAAKRGAATKKATTKKAA